MKKSKGVLPQQKGRQLWKDCKEKDFNIPITIGFNTSFFFHQMIEKCKVRLI